MAAASDIPSIPTNISVGGGGTEQSLGAELYAQARKLIDGSEPPTYYNPSKARDLIVKAATLRYLPAVAKCVEEEWGAKKDVALINQCNAAAAEENDSWGMCGVAFMYGTGRGIQAPNLMRAFEWYRQAANLDNPVALFNLALMYESGRGVEQDSIMAVKMFLQSAMLGYAKAQNNLGWMYQNGWGVDADNAKALQWYLKSAKQGFAIAQRNVGYMLSQGEGVEKDEKQAFEWYKQAAKNDPLSLYLVGFCYANGRGVERNDEEAVAYYQKGADADQAQCLNGLAFMMENGRGIKQNIHRAVELYLRSLKQGNTTARENLKVLKLKLQEELRARESPRECKVPHTARSSPIDHRLSTDVCKIETTRSHKPGDPSNKISKLFRASRYNPEMDTSSSAERTTSTSTNSAKQALEVQEKHASQRFVSLSSDGNDENQHADSVNKPHQQDQQQQEEKPPAQPCPPRPSRTRSRGASVSPLADNNSSNSDSSSGNKDKPPLPSAVSKPPLSSFNRATPSSNRKSRARSISIKNDEERKRALERREKELAAMLAGDDETPEQLRDGEDNQDSEEENRALSPRVPPRTGSFPTPPLEGLPPRTAKTIPVGPAASFTASQAAAAAAAMAADLRAGGPTSPGRPQKSNTFSALSSPRNASPPSSSSTVEKSLSSGEGGVGAKPQLVHTDSGRLIQLKDKWKKKDVEDSKEVRKMAKELEALKIMRESAVKGVQTKEQENQQLRKWREILEKANEKDAQFISDLEEELRLTREMEQRWNDRVKNAKAQNAIVRAHICEVLSVVEKPKKTTPLFSFAF